MLSRWFQGIIYCLALPINSITSTQVFYGLVGKDHDLELRDEKVPFLTQSFFTCASKDNCDEVAKEHGKGEFKEVVRKEAIEENNVVYKKVKPAEVIGKYISKFIEYLQLLIYCAEIFYLSLKKFLSAYAMISRAKSSLDLERMEWLERNGTK